MSDQPSHRPHEHATHAHPADDGTPVVAILPSRHVLSHSGPLTGWLTPAEWARVNRLPHQEDRIDCVAAHVLARWVWGAWKGVDPRSCQVSQGCPSCPARRGCPRVLGHPDDSISWARAAGWVAAAAGSGPLGVDVEMVPAPVADEESGVWCWTADAARIGHWVRAECCMKAGLADLDESLDWSYEDVTALPAPGDVLHEAWGHLTFTTCVLPQAPIVLSVLSLGATHLVHPRDVLPKVA